MSRKMIFEFHARPQASGYAQWRFHRNEALGCSMICRIIRTRDQQVLDDLDVTLDVRGVYDPSLDRYDHHQDSLVRIRSSGSTSGVTKAMLRNEGMGAFYKGLSSSPLRQVTYTTSINKATSIAP
ncbi:hypothetical protein AAG906_022092 [Vitis piasezkii]